MTPQTPQSLVAEVESLFVLPDAVLRLNTLLDAPDANARDICAVVELDPGLVSSVLHLSNSAVYGQRGKVDTVARAIDLIGRRALRDMVLASSVTQVFADIPTEFVDMASFWDNSITCGVVTQLLARHIRARDADSLFLAGLLHGVGRLVFYARRPDEYRALLATKPADEKTLATAEQHTFGFNYAELGAALLANWALPERICAAIAHQLEPEATRAVHAREVAIVHIANDIASSLAPCLKQRGTPSTWVPGFDPGASQILGISNQDLEAIRLEALLQTFEVIEIINPGSTLIY